MTLSHTWRLPLLFHFNTSFWTFFFPIEPALHRSLLSTRLCPEKVLQSDILEKDQQPPRGLWACIHPQGPSKSPPTRCCCPDKAPVCPWWQCSGFLALRVVSSPPAFPALPFWRHMLLNIVHGWFPALLSWGSRRNLLFICCWCCHCHPPWVCSYTYTLLYPKQTTNKDLLHSTGNSAQCYVTA